MRRLAFLAILAAGAALTACEAETGRSEAAPVVEPAPAETELPPAEEPAPEAAPPAESEAGYQAPATEPRSSEESVQPESETLFY